MNDDLRTQPVEQALAHLNHWRDMRRAAEEARVKLQRSVRCLSAEELAEYMKIKNEAEDEESEIIEGAAREGPLPDGLRAEATREEAR
jgi:hypothetical protein